MCVRCCREIISCFERNGRVNVQLDWILRAETMTDFVQLTQDEVVQWNKVVNHVKKIYAEDALIKAGGE